MFFIEQLRLRRLNLRPYTLIVESFLVHNVEELGSGSVDLLCV